MLALRINRSHPINRLQNDLGRLFESAFDGFPNLTGEARQTGTFPPVNVWEDADSLFIEAELPGWHSEDIELSIVGDEMTLSGRREACCDDDVSYHCKERSVSQFNRTFRLPVDVKTDDVQAALRDGVLLVTLPKADQVKPKTIEIKTTEA